MLYNESNSPLLFSPQRLQAQRDIIFELRRIAFDAESEPNASSGSMEKRKSMYTRDYKKLGFIVSKPRPVTLHCRGADRGADLGADLGRLTDGSAKLVVRLRLSESFSHFPDV